MRTMETKNRPRHVVFRVSDEEHKYISDACFEAGIRSVSEFVRQAALHFAETRRSNRSLLSDDLTTVALRLEELDGYLRDLSSVIIRILGPAHRPSAPHGEISTASSDSPLEASEPESLSVTPAQTAATGFAGVIALRKSV
jgi:hypothetical protein